MDNCSLDEYLKLVEIIHDYDSILLTIKGWGVTLSLAAIGIGFKEKVWGYFLLAAISGLNFWGVEYFMKGYQMQYYPRMRAIEVIQYKKKCDFPPSIDYSWYVSKGILNGEEEKEIIYTAPEIRGKYSYYIWYSRITIVAFPHVFSVILGLIFSCLSFFRIGRFKEYKN